MKLTPESLRDFLAILPHYDRLSAAGRRDLASIEHSAKSCSAFVFRDSLEGLMDTGFLLPPESNGRCAIGPSRLGFLRTLRMLSGHPVFRSPGQASFDRYMAAHLTAGERQALRNGSDVSYYERNLVLYGQIASSDWVENFLGAKDDAWESQYRERTDPPLLARPEVLSSTQKIVRWLMAHGGRVVLRNLPALTLSRFGEPDPELLSLALHAALRYALLFLSIEPDSLDAVLGVWPEIVAEVPVIPPPRNVTPEETCDPIFLLEDMTALLVACATGPLRLRSNDDKLYAKTVRDLAATLRPLPPWAAAAFHMDPETRVETTFSYVQTFRLVNRSGFPTEMTVNGRGREWLGLPMGERLRVLMDGVLDQKQTVAAFRDFTGANVGRTPYFHVRTSMKMPPDIVAATMAVFRSLQGDGFYSWKEIMASSQASNPLAEIARKDKYAYFGDTYGYMTRLDTGAVQKLWNERVYDFLRARLLPLGGVRLGHGQDGVSIAITPAGRYYLGQSKQWQWAAAGDSQVIVQPNFEVTFLGEAPAAEAEIGRFAERRSQRIGALFQITKKSIFAAAAAGMTAKGVLEILEHVCTREVPGNVRREIQGWFGQCRKVSFESAVLIRCPDRETTLRVIGLAKDSVTALNDTVLEYRENGRQRPWLIKKLKEMGVLVSQDGKAVPQRGSPGGSW